MPNNPRSRSQRGAVAVIFAVCATLMFGVAALGVDLGNAMNRKKQVQTDADLAALAGGGGLPATNTTPTAADDVVKLVAEYLICNGVQDDTATAFPPRSVCSDKTATAFTSARTTVASKLVSNAAADKTNYGHVYYGYFDASGTLVPSKNYVTVQAPKSQINFGLAAAIGVGSTQVAAQATAGIKSIGSVGATLPFYAYDGCDWGQQVISHSTANATAPVLYAPSDDNGVAVSLSSTAAPNASPNQVVKNDTTTVLRLSGTGLTASTAPADNTKPGVISVGLFLPDGTAPTEIPAGQFKAGSNDSQILFSLPATVAANEGATYYLRVATWVNTGNKNNPNYVKKWSAVAIGMAYVDVGDVTLFCNDDKNAGNFGSLSVFRMDINDSASAGWLPVNIAKGLDIPNVLLNKYTATINNSSCGNGDPNGFDSDKRSSGVKVNCVVTDTGFPQNPATNGFITGVSTSPITPGRLTNTAAGCGGANGKPPIRTLFGYNLNNEVLSCYLTDATKTIGQVSSESYSGDVAFSADIFSSPRFFWVPVVNSQPANGTKSFPIVDFRAAFMTGENGTAVKGHAATNSYYWDDPTTNGLVVSGNNANNLKVESFRVVFINPKALPPVPGNGNPVEYVGSGPKILLLVN